jgi:hypothetical protein
MGKILWKNVFWNWFIRPWYLFKNTRFRGYYLAKRFASQEHLNEANKRMAELAAYENYKEPL